MSSRAMRRLQEAQGLGGLGLPTPEVDDEGEDDVVPQRTFGAPRNAFSLVNKILFVRYLNFFYKILRFRSIPNEVFFAK